MPLYEFRCESCGHEMETILAFSDPLPTTCETCGGTLKKLLAAPAVQFKGSGFYLTDYGRRNQPPNRVHLISVGRVGPPALHAAALEPQLFASVTLKRCVTSWSDVVQTPHAVQQLVNVVHGALKTYDLPDLLATLPKEKVKVYEPYDAMEKPAARR